MRRRGVSVLEVLLASSLAAALFALGISSAGWSRKSGQGAVVARVDLQYQARVALTALAAELEDSIEIVRPPPGATLDYFVVRDRRNHLVVGYPELTPGGGAPLRVCLFRRDTATPERETGRRVLWPRVQEVAFTAVAPDLLQVRLVLEDDSGVRFPVLTAIRCRNASAEAIP